MVDDVPFHKFGTCCTPERAGSLYEVAIKLDIPLLFYIWLELAEEHFDHIFFAVPGSYEQRSAFLALFFHNLLEK